MSEMTPRQEPTSGSSQSGGALPAVPTPATPGQAGGVAATADLVQPVTQIDRAVKERRDSDTQLVNYWLYLFLLGPVTLGIYGLFLFFKRITRVDRFSERKHPYYESLIDWTERYARQEGKEDAVHHMLTDMRAEIAAAYEGNLRKINAGMSLLITIVTIGIYGLYVLYRMNRYWWDAQVVEQEFDDKLSQAWLNLDLMRYPISFKLDQGKRRSYPLYLILSIVTIGIWGIVWDYKIHTDPDNLYKEFHSIEDTVLQTIRAH